MVSIVNVLNAEARPGVGQRSMALIILSQRFIVSGIFPPSSSVSEVQSCRLELHQRRSQTAFSEGKGIGDGQSVKDLVQQVDFFRLTALCLPPRFAKSGNLERRRWSRNESSVADRTCAMLCY
jgi:hypothetical protein